MEWLSHLNVPYAWKLNVPVRLSNWFNVRNIFMFLTFRKRLKLSRVPDRRQSRHGRQPLLATSALAGICLWHLHASDVHTTKFSITTTPPKQRNMLKMLKMCKHAKECKRSIMLKTTITVGRQRPVCALLLRIMTNFLNQP